MPSSASPTASWCCTPARTSPKPAARTPERPDPLRGPGYLREAAVRARRARPRPDPRISAALAGHDGAGEPGDGGVLPRRAEGEGANAGDGLRDVSAARETIGAE